jgi:DNA-binding NarL/FixJ family response regulator
VIKILLADDDRVKTASIVRAVNDAFQQGDIDITTVADAFSAKKSMLETQFDILILDIYLPNRHGDDPAIENSLHIVKELTESTKFIPPIHIIGITQFDDAEAASKAAFYGNLFHIVKYDNSSLAWKQAIVACIRYFISVKENIIEKVSEEYDYDVAIITAVQTPEFVAVLDLVADWKKIQYHNDNSLYYSGLFKNEEKTLKVVSSVANQMGLPAASTLASKLIVHFKPRYLACVGIAAGVKGKGNYGDVLVGDMVFDYGSGKILSGAAGEPVIHPDPNSIHLDSYLKD